MQDYLKNRGKLQEPFKSGDGSLKDAGGMKGPGFSRMMVRMTYQNARLP